MLPHLYDRGISPLRARMIEDMTAVLHSWGPAMTHHPHVHMIVPGGGLSLDGTHWVPCRPGFFLPVRVLSRLFRRLTASTTRRRMPLPVPQPR
jgi:hypothetical protein